MNIRPVPLLGIPDVDDDHEILGAIITELSEAGQHGRSKQHITAILRRLVAQASQHFEAELDQMKRDRYPCINVHRDEHTRLLRCIEILANSVINDLIEVDEGLICSLWEWENHHILTSDREYAEYLRTREDSRSDGTARPLGNVRQA